MIIMIMLILVLTTQKKTKKQLKKINKHDYLLPTKNRNIKNSNYLITLYLHIQWVTKTCQHLDTLIHKYYDYNTVLLRSTKLLEISFQLFPYIASVP